MYKKACDAGDARSCTAYAHLQRLGIGGPAEPARALCTREHNLACRHRALRAFHAADYASARIFFERDCALGHDAQSCTLVTVLHSNAQGSPPDFEAASRALESGCQLGDHARTRGCYIAAVSARGRRGGRGCGRRRRA